MADKQYKLAEDARIKLADAAADAAKELVPYNPSRTLPSHAPNPNAKPTGSPIEIKANANEQRSLRRENEVMVEAVKAGYVTEQNRTVPGSKAPDTVIEQKVFDCYSPESTTDLNSIGKTILVKVVTKKQTRRILLNMDDADQTISVQDIRSLAVALQQTTVPKLEEVLVWQAGQFHHAFP